MAAVDERVADRDSAMALDPEQDVVGRLPPGEDLDSKGQFVRTMTVSRSAARSSIGVGGMVGSISSSRSPSSSAYAETSGPHSRPAASSSAVHSG